jgi:hypothetical protein
MTTPHGASMPPCPNLAGEPQACRVRKRPIAVSVSFAPSDGVTETLEGAVRHEAGDAIVTGVHGENWPIQRDAFAASYEPVAPTGPGQPGTYMKRPVIVLALRLGSVMTVPVGRHGDPLHGRPGDWLLQYEDGSYGVVCDGIFRATYERI